MSARYRALSHATREKYDSARAVVPPESASARRRSDNTKAISVLGRAIGVPKGITSNHNGRRNMEPTARRDGQKQGCQQPGEQHGAGCDLADNNWAVGREDGVRKRGDSLLSLTLSCKTYIDPWATVGGSRFTLRSVFSGSEQPTRVTTLPLRSFKFWGGVRFGDMHRFLVGGYPGPHIARWSPFLSEVHVHSRECLKLGGENRRIPTILK